MSMRKLTVTGLCGMLALSVSPAFAINIDATFSAGASLSDFGFAGGGVPDPNTNVGGGVWNNALAAGEASYWSRPSTVNEYAGNVVHGFADITAGPISNVPDDLTLIRTASVADNYLARLGMVPGRLELQTYPGGIPATNRIPIPNADGLEHQYGWELDRSTRNVKLFFDGAPIGDASGYSIIDNQADPNDSFYLGDGTGGNAHTDVWNRVVVAEGAFPAPAVVPGVRTSGLFSFGYGATAGNPNTWTTVETSLLNSPTAMGNFTFTPTVAGPVNSFTGPTFLDRVLGNGSGSTVGGYGLGFSVQIDGTYTGPTPADAAANPNYQLRVDVQQISIRGALFGGTQDTLGFNETTAGHAQSQTPATLDFNGPVQLASVYGTVQWNPSDYASAGSTQSRTFDLSSSNFGNINLDGLEIFGRVVLTYDTVGGVQDDADFDGDNDVDGNDFLIWQRGLGLSGAAATNAAGNANGDGFVNGADLAIWKSEFGTPQGLAAASAVPEPGSLLLLGLTGSLWAMRSRHETRRESP